ncbi:MAG: lysine--tRNA ligase [Gemmatimonadota bacterium]
MTEDLNQVLKARLEKLETLKERGIDPFPYRFQRTHEAIEAIRFFEEAEKSKALDEGGHGASVRVGGRLKSFRGHGKSAFGHLEDGSGPIQVYFRKDVLGEESFRDVLELIDLGDWVGVEGPLFRTRTGEVTVRAESWELLSKSLRPLPMGKTEVDQETGEKITYSGFSDVESRYRQRYADLAVHPEVREVFRVRSRVITAIRRFMDGEGFLEVETPALQPLYGGASARPFVTRHNALDRTMYLRIADELYLKRLIVGGFERVYEIAKDFRNEGIDRTHNPEFTMLEFYQAFADYQDMMELVERLTVHVADEALGSRSLTFQGREISLEPPFQRIRLLDALEEALGKDPLELPEEELKDRAQKLRLPELEGAGRGKLLDKLFEALIQDDLQQPTFITDYPRELSPLAKPHRSDPRLTERFELFIAGREVANAFSELNDPLDQRARFEEQAGLRARGDDEAQRLDEDYIRALEYGMPPTGGVGIGIDRLVMLLTDQASIRDVILFPVLRTEE